MYQNGHMRGDIRYWDDEMGDVIERLRRAHRGVRIDETTKGEPMMDPPSLCSYVTLIDYAPEYRLESKLKVTSTVW